MAEVLIVSKTVMGQLYCIGGLDLSNMRSLRLLDGDRRGFPHDTQLEIGDVWKINYRTVRNITRPHTEDVSATLVGYLREANVEDVVDESGVRIFVGDTRVLFDGKLYWTSGGSGYMEPEEATAYSTCFWRPKEALVRTQFGEDYSFIEKSTAHHTKWKGVAKPPRRVAVHSLCRMSLSTGFAGALDHEVCWLQLSGVY